MYTNIIDMIRVRQKKLSQQDSTLPSVVPHRPDMLYIGCVDARLDPVADIGIPQGKALIYRNIGALVRPAAAVPGGGQMDQRTAANGEIPESVSMGAVLEFFIDPNNIPAPGGDGIKHIVVSGHTHCGGIHACKHHKGEEGGYLQRYLSSLTNALKVILGLNLHDEQKELRALEKESVRQSYDNLMSYKVVSDAVERGDVQLHAWVIDTATHRIEEMDEDRQFKPMWEIRQRSFAEAENLPRGLKRILPPEPMSRE